MLKIIIAEDHPIFAMGVKNIVRSIGYTNVESYTNGIIAYNHIMQKHPILAILDVNMPGMSGLEILKQIRLNKIPTKVILLTMHKEISIYNKARELGVEGFILKDNNENDLETCIRKVLNGEKFKTQTIEMTFFINQDSDFTTVPKITFAEKKVLGLLAENKTNKQIAELLFISEKTVEGHRANIVKKLNLPKGKNSLLVWASKNFKAFENYIM
ncbi:response regulator transcription factor [Emticicia sp. 17c]|uniref:response regulator transcription factor n=1 Tax=Emticicia sp. 17c TaxID=3127704 RepID=UPI00301D5A2B